MHLVPIITVEEIELAQVSMQVAWQMEELSRLRAQLAPLERAFSTFEQRVAQQSGHLTAERDRLRQKCSELETYTTRLHARLIADPEGMMSEIFSPAELRRIGELCGVDVPDDWFGEELRATTFGDGWFSTDEDWEETPAAAPVFEDASESDELRTLYRHLARTFHPDLTSDDRERDFRQEVMLRINHAWHLRDLQALRTIGNDVQDLLEGKLVSVVAYQLAWYRRELSRLQADSQACRDRIAALRSSRTVTLWHNAALANTAISRHISRLKQEIEDLHQRHTSALEDFRQALLSYTTSR